MQSNQFFWGFQEPHQLRSNLRWNLKLNLKATFTLTQALLWERRNLQEQCNEKHKDNNNKLLPVSAEMVRSSLVWLDREAELLLNLAFGYKMIKIQENIGTGNHVSQSMRTYRHWFFIHHDHNSQTNHIQVALMMLPTFPSHTVMFNSVTPCLHANVKTEIL